MRSSTAPTGTASDRRFFVFNAVVSAAALGLLAWLLLFRGGGDGRYDLRFMPAVNAAFNAITASLLVAGVVAIKRGERAVHQRLMVLAFATSSLFLVGYLAYHYVHGDTRYVGPYRGAYLALLASHVLASIPVLPMALAAFYFAAQERFETHRKVARVLFPIWLYTSVTGVIVYFVLRGSAPAVG